MVGSAYTQTVLPLLVVLVSLCGGRLLNDASCAGVVGGVALKPEEDSMFSLFPTLFAQAVTAAHDPRTARIDQNGFTTHLPEARTGQSPKIAS